MTPLQKLQVEQSENREKIAGIMAREVGPEERNQLAALSSRSGVLEREIRAALVAEPEVVSVTNGPDSPEGREIRGLMRQASLANFMMEAAREVPIQGGPEHEIRQALLGSEARPGIFPIDMLVVPGMERRADAATNVASSALADGSQAPILPRVFTRSIAAHMGVDMPMVPTGAANYPIMTGGTAAGMQSEGGAQDATAATFTGETLEPTRLSARYLFRVEDTAKLPNYEAALRMDLDATMSDKMDDQIMNGNGTSPNVSGFVGELPNVSNPGAVTTWNGHLEEFTGQVDGINAFDLADLKTVMSKQSFQYLEGLFRTGATDNGPRASACQYVKGMIGGQMVSSRMPHTGNNSTNLMALTSYPGRNAVAPLWRGMEMIRDPYSRAAHGEVALTAITLWNFKILREAGWTLFKTRVA